MNTWFVCLPVRKYEAFEQKKEYELGLKPKWCRDFISIWISKPFISLI